LKHGSFAARASEILAKQALATAAVAGGMAWGGWTEPAKGCLYGGGLAMVLGLMLSANLQRAADSEDSGRGARILYLGAIERFLLVAAAVVAAITLWDLHVGGLVAGLIVAHIISFIEAVRQNWPQAN
jgi:hypothetical protein